MVGHLKRKDSWKRWIQVAYGSPKHRESRQSTWHEPSQRTRGRFLRNAGLHGIGHRQWLRGGRKASSGSTLVDEPAFLKFNLVCFFFKLFKLHPAHRHPPPSQPLSQSFLRHPIPFFSERVCPTRYLPHPGTSSLCEARPFLSHWGSLASRTYPTDRQQLLG